MNGKDFEATKPMQATDGSASARENLVGRQVMVDTGDKKYNGNHIFPAFVTAHWSNLCVNVRVLVDGTELPWLTSLGHKSDVSGPSQYNQPRPVYWFYPHEAPIA